MYLHRATFEGRPPGKCLVSLKLNTGLDEPPGSFGRVHWIKTASALENVHFLTTKSASK